jgi:diguanylate cyclase (GGDEF)-like protein
MSERPDCNDGSEKVEDSDFSLRAMAELRRGLEDMKEPSEVALKMAATLMKLLNIDSGGVVMLDEEGQYRLIDVLSLVKESDDLRVEKMSLKFQRRNVRGFFEDLEKSNYFAAIRSVSGVEICPTDNFGVDAYIPIRDEEGRIAVVLFLDKTDEALNLAGYRGELEKIMKEWTEIYSDVSAERKSEKNAFSRLLGQMVDNIYSKLKPKVFPESQDGVMRSASVEGGESFSPPKEESDRDLDLDLDTDRVEINTMLILLYICLRGGTHFSDEIIKYVKDEFERYVKENSPMFMRVIEALHEVDAKRVMADILEVFIKDKFDEALTRSRLNEQRITDEQTGFYRKEWLMHVLQEEIQRGDEEGSFFGILMIDIDNFKAINDTHGHLAGDIVLEEVARRIRAFLRPYDIPARFGGEEFVIVLPGRHMGGTAVLAHDILESINGRPVKADLLNDRKLIPVTVSIGINLFKGERKNVRKPFSGQRIEEVINEADQGMYFVKRNGRNNVGYKESIILRLTAETWAQLEKESKRKTKGASYY